MALVTVMRIFKLGLTNYWRNRGLSLSATLILTLTLFIVVIFALLNTILTTASEEIREKIDLAVTFDDEIQEDQIISLQKVLAARSDVREVRLVTKEEALVRFQELPGVSDRTKGLVTPENNPLPRSLEVKTGAPEQLGAVSDLLAEPPWKDIIRRNSYVTNRETIERISQYERAVMLAGIALSLTFVGISLIVVINTIRLAIFARREEIEIMRLVGANNAFIRIPFVIEGILYGLFAAALALGAAWLVALRLGEFMGQFLAEIALDLPALFLAQLPTLIATELAIGLGVGILASLVSVQRYLHR